MKKIILLLFLLISGQLFAQSEEPLTFLEGNPIWVYKYLDEVLA